jgi:hypothetical protein
MVEIAEMFQMPKAIDKHFSNRGYYGSVKGARYATIQVVKPGSAFPGSSCCRIQPVQPWKASDFG